MEVSVLTSFFVFQKFLIDEIHFRFYLHAEFLFTFFLQLLAKRDDLFSCCSSIINQAESLLLPTANVSFAMTAIAQDLIENSSGWDLEKPALELIDFWFEIRLEVF